MRHSQASDAPSFRCHPPWRTVVHRGLPLVALGVALLLVCPPRVLGQPAGEEDPGFRVVAHPATTVDALLRVTLSEIFLGKRPWPDGTTAEVVDQHGRSAAREAFSREVHGRTVAGVRSYWQRQIFSGQTSAPPELESDAEVLAHVRQTPAAIGYVSSAADLSGVLVLDIIDPPKLDHHEPPRYPSVARRMRAEGVAILSVTIDAEGRVNVVEPVNQLRGGLTDAAIQAVRKWRYQPARRNEQPIPITIEVKVRFEL